MIGNIWIVKTLQKKSLELAWDLWPALPSILIIQARRQAPVLLHRLPECKDRKAAESLFSSLPSPSFCCWGSGQQRLSNSSHHFPRVMRGKNGKENVIREEVLTAPPHTLQYWTTICSCMFSVPSKYFPAWQWNEYNISLEKDRLWTSHRTKGWTTWVLAFLVNQPLYVERLVTGPPSTWLTFLTGTVSYLLIRQQDK